MDAVQRRGVEQKRASGSSYSNIAAILGLSTNTVKSYCHRNHLDKKKAPRILAIFVAVSSCKYLV